MRGEAERRDEDEADSGGSPGRRADAPLGEGKPERKEEAERDRPHREEDERVREMPVVLDVELGRERIRKGVRVREDGREKPDDRLPASEARIEVRVARAGKTSRDQGAGESVGQRIHGEPVGRGSYPVP